MYKEVAQKIMYAFRQHGKLHPLANLSDEIEEILKRYFPEPIDRPTLYVGKKKYVSDKPQNLD